MDKNKNISLVSHKNLEPEFIRLNSNFKPDKITLLCQIFFFLAKYVRKVSNILRFNLVLNL